MKEKMRTKKHLILICLSIAVLTFSALFGAFYKAQAKNILVTELFTTYDVEIGTAKEVNGEKAISLTPSGAGSKVYFNGEFAGDFTAEISLDYSGTAYFNFDDGTYSFDIGVSNGKTFNVFARVGGEKAGIYYLSDVNVGNTSVYNANGEFTQLEKGGKCKLSFDFTNMNVYCSDGTDNYLVWRLAEEETAGRSIPVVPVFGKYRVSLNFETASGRMPFYLYSVNGTELKSVNVSESRPVVGAKKEFEAISGKEYAIPEPYARDLVEGRIESVGVKVYNSDGVEILDGNYAKGLSFLPSRTSDSYTVKYTAKNTAGLTGTYDLFVKNFKSVEESEIIYDLGGVDFKSEYGLNSTVFIPSASVKSKAVTGTTVEVFYSVKVNGAYLEEYEKVSASSSDKVVLSKEGNYTITWFTDEALVPTTEQRSFSVSASLTGLITDFNSTMLAVGSEVVIPSSKITVDGEIYSAKTKVIFPSGSCFANPVFNASEKGLYEIVFYATTDDGYYEMRKTFIAADSAETLFSGDSNTTFELGHSNVTSKVKGIHVTTKNNEVATYNNVINLNELTRDDLLLELMADVTEVGAADFTDFNITLTDIYDSDNYITINGMFSGLANSNGNGTYIKTAASNGQVMAGWYGGTPAAKNIQKVFGYDARHSFIGKSDTGDIAQNTFKLYFDYSELRLYSGPVVVTGNNQHLVQDYLVMDYDDTTFQSIPWEGFTTGEVRLSISVSGAQYVKVGYTICAIGGVSLDKATYANEKNPAIVLESEDVPFGIKDMRYEFRKASAYSADDNSALTVEKTLYYNYGKSSVAEIATEGDGFTPKMSGTYTLELKAVDKFGNLSVRYMEIVVYAEAEDLDFEQTALPSAAYLGTYLTIPEVTAYSGASGEISVAYSVTAGGTEVAYSGNSFKITKTGEYKVTTTVTDYLGRKEVKVQTVEVLISNDPVVTDEIILPEYLLMGYTYDLPIVKGYDYVSSESGKAVTPVISVKINGEERTLSGGRLVAEEADGVYDTEIIYTYTSQSGKYVYSKTVKTFSVRSGERYSFDNFFLAENCEKTLDKDGIHLSATGTAKFAFIKDLSSKSFKTTFIVNQNETANFNYIDINLTDYEKAFAYTLKLQFTNGSLFAVTEGKKTLVTTTKKGEDGLSFVIAISDNAIIDSAGTIIAYMNEGGHPFSSGRLYFDAEFSVSSQSTLIVSEVNNQNISSDTSYDRSAPEMIL
ncbi:MAG: hypothetical protein IJS67_02985 [Clostridia bacterium]|nr:hypothetical protein [Clostridia bacterium]